jgi:1-deoxy-D-xylulose-5-phosphate synthase
VTHQGAFDIIYLRGIPNFTVLAASSAEELEAMLEFGVALGSPCAIRYPKSPVSSRQSPVIKLGKAEVLREGKDAAIIALGAMVEPALRAAEVLMKEGIDLCVVNARFIKPLDRELFLDLAGRFKYLITIEDGILDGGFGSAVQESVNRPLLRLGLPCEFIEHAGRGQLLEKYGLDVKGIVQSLRNAIH